jgi:hypothetical protein
MVRPTALCLVVVTAAFGCGSSSSNLTAGDASTPDARTDSGMTMPPVDSGADSGQTGPEAGPEAGPDAAAATTTIAMARMSGVTTAITVNGFVTALAGVPKDYPQWYIEDPAGGPYSGVLVYCDPLASKACTVPEPALHDLIQVTGTLTTYMGQLELEPTAMVVLQSNATPPPVATFAPADVAPAGNSMYRGVYGKLTLASKLTVDSVTPPALANTSSSCGAVFPPDGGAGDAGPPACTAKCTPPVYSGFRANDGAGNEVYIEAPFFNTDPLQSSPECLTQPGVVPVTVGMTFSAMSGVLDVDPYSAAQGLSPVLPSDYVTP